MASLTRPVSEWPNFADVTRQLMPFVALSLFVERRAGWNKPIKRRLNGGRQEE